MKSVLYGISTGPGDPELLTLKAVRLINFCDVIAAPRTNSSSCLALDIVSEVCDLSRKEIILCDLSMARDREKWHEGHKKASEMIIKYLSEGKNVAFLSIGDISVYSTFSYIQKFVSEAGFDTEICAGVTSFCASAAAAKRPLVQGRNPLLILPSSCGGFDEYAGLDCTRVIMKSGKSIADVKKKLSEKCSPDSVYAVCSCGMPDERIYFGTDNIPDDSGYFTTIIAEGGSGA